MPALPSKKSTRLGAIFGAAYGLIHAFTASTLVFQPSTDFGAAYGVTALGWVGISCCGTFGTVLKLILFTTASIAILLVSPAIIASALRRYLNSSCGIR